MCARRVVRWVGCEGSHESLGLERVVERRLEFMLDGVLLVTCPLRRIGNCDGAVLNLSVVILDGISPICNDFVF